MKSVARQMTRRGVRSREAAEAGASTSIVLRDTAASALPSTNSPNNPLLSLWLWQQCAFHTSSHRNYKGVWVRGESRLKVFHAKQQLD